MLNSFQFPTWKELQNLNWFMQIGFQIHPIIFLERDNKAKLLPASFSYFLELF